MSNVNLTEVKEETIHVELFGRVDTSNAAEVEKEFDTILENAAGKAIEIDVEKLQYISSAGLRVLLKIKKTIDNVKIINASNEVYEIFEVTGFSSILDVTKALRSISIEGCPEIGHGANGTVYRLDQETIVKVYNRDTGATLDYIKREQESSRKAFVYGMPTAISYDVVKVGEHYGVVYEMLNAESVSEHIMKYPEKLEEMAEKLAKLAKDIHAIETKEGEFQNNADVITAHLPELKGHVSDEEYAQVEAAMLAVPGGNHLVHGDFHGKNVMVQNGVFVLIDMGDVAQGNPLIDFMSMYQLNDMIGGRLSDRVEQFSGLPIDMYARFYEVFLKTYFGEKYTAENMALYQQAMKIMSAFRNAPQMCTRMDVLGDNVPAGTHEMVAGVLKGLLAIKPEMVAGLFSQIEKALF